MICYQCIIALWYTIDFLKYAIVLSIILLVFLYLSNPFSYRWHQNKFHPSSISKILLVPLLVLPEYGQIKAYKPTGDVAE